MIGANPCFIRVSSVFHPCFIRVQSVAESWLRPKGCAGAYVSFLVCSRYVVFNRALLEIVSMPMLRLPLIATAALMLTACAVLAADKPAKKKEVAVGKPVKPPELVVWSGDNAPGQTWAKMGPKGSLAVAAEAGVGKSGKGLELRFDGEGWRGCGVNWKGWFPEDACDDASRYSSLVFQIRQVSQSPRRQLWASRSSTTSNADGKWRDRQQHRRCCRWRRDRENRRDVAPGRDSTGKILLATSPCN